MDILNSLKKVANFAIEATEKECKKYTREVNNLNNLYYKYSSWAKNASNDELIEAFKERKRRGITNTESKIEYQAYGNELKNRGF